MQNRANRLPTYRINSHCSYCGAPFEAYACWPRHCSHCENISFQNPIPVTVVLIPVDDGVLVVRRAIEPFRGLYALPGGYIESGETWQEAGAREVKEEADVTIMPHHLRVIRVFSAPDNTLIICAQAPQLRNSDLPQFRPTPEVSDRLVLREPRELAFPLHTELVDLYLSTHGSLPAPKSQFT